MSASSRRSLKSKVAGPRANVGKTLLRTPPMTAEFVNIHRQTDEVNGQALAICQKNVQGFDAMNAGTKTDIHRAVVEALSGVHHSDKVQIEPHRVCQNYAQMRNQEMASRIIGVVMPHWRGSVKTAAAAQVQLLLDRELTRMWNDIESFHHKFGLSYGGAPRALPWDLAEFRIKFLQEELDEYAAAYEADDTVHSREQMLDALVDLVYVALGTAYLHGFNFAEAWRRVQVANMSKVRVERAEDSKRGSTFDVVKPAGWKPPSHKDLVGSDGPSQAPHTNDSGQDPDLGTGDPVSGRPTDWAGAGSALRDAQLEARSLDEEGEPETGQPAGDHELF